MHFLIFSNDRLSSTFQPRLNKPPDTPIRSNETTRLCLDESTAGLETTLPGAEVLLTLGNGGLLDVLLTLGQDELDVARVGHVGVDLVWISTWDTGEGKFWSKHTRPWAR